MTSAIRARSGDMAVTTEEGSWRGVYRLGGIALTWAGVWYALLTLSLVAIIARGEHNPLVSPQAMLDQIIETPLLPRLNAFMAVIADLAQVVGLVVVMLYLRNVDRAWPILAVVPISVAVIYDMQDGLVQWAMTYSYAGYPTASEAVRSALDVQAELVWQYIYKVATPFMAIMLGLSVAMASWAMRKSDLAPWTVHLGLAAAALAIIGGATTLFPLLLAVSPWYIAVGLQMLQRARSTT